MAFEIKTNYISFEKEISELTRMKIDVQNIKERRSFSEDTLIERQERLDNLYKKVKLKQICILNYADKNINTATKMKQNLNVLLSSVLDEFGTRTQNTLPGTFSFGEIAPITFGTPVSFSRPPTQVFGTSAIFGVPASNRFVFGTR